MTPTSSTAYRLFHLGMQAFADMEERGFLLDMDYVREAKDRLADETRQYESELESTRLYQVWSDTYGFKINLGSGPQLANILFNKLGYTPPKQTKRGGTATDEEALSMIPEPGLDELISIKQRDKAFSTYLQGFLTQAVDGVIHPFYNLHTTTTYRSSSSEPNFQNIPIRNPAVGPVIRRAIIAPPEFHFGEIDISGAEVRVGACYHKDESMIGYITDASKDMHRDAAMDIFGLTLDLMTKAIRQSVKGDWVFAQFYGSFFKNCAAKLWRKCLGIKTADGRTIGEHLADQGIATYSQFEKRCQEAEDQFWNVRFKGYTSWKERRWQEYLRKGHFDTLTGFRCGGYMSRNAATNYPIQGSAFHVLLRLVIDMNRWLKRANMKTHIVGQVHDSVIPYIHYSETKEVFAFIADWFANLHKSWKWVVVPLDYEIEMSPLGGSWAEKKEVKV